MDYEGELGVIIGKAGFSIKEENAMDYVWGYTIINGKFVGQNQRSLLINLDLSARERQRDHRQYFMGKSPDTFCPMVCLDP